MNKLKEICNKFLLLKKRFDKPGINFLCNHSYRSLTGEIKGLYKEEKESSKTDPNFKSKTNEKQAKEGKANILGKKSSSKNINNNDCFKKIIMSLESSNLKTKNENKNNKINVIENSISNSNIKKNKDESVTPSIKEMNDNSPTILNDEDNDNKTNKKNNNEDLDIKILSNNNTIKLNEDEENSNANNKNDIKKQKYKKFPSINIIDKDDKNINIKEIIIDNFSSFGTQLGKLTEKVTSMSSIEAFYNEQRQKIISLNLNDGDIIYIEAIKKIIHLFFNTLSKIFKCIARETENMCSLCLNNILDIINLIIDCIKPIKKFIKNNNKNVDIMFLKDIKIIANYCLYVLCIKKSNYEYMLEIQKKKENDKINTFFHNYMKYFKTINKVKIILKDNNMFIKHFTIQPTMINYIELFEMNRRIINYQLNVNYK